MIHPIILAGGIGTRLWPLSRKSYPKQFANVVGEQSLFQATVKRLTGPDFAPPTIMTHNDFRFTVAEQISDIKVEPAHIVIEPESRDTAPAVLSAALMLENSPEALMLVVPSDHLVEDAAAFQKAIRTGVKAAKAGRIVAFGVQVKPQSTGHGYLEPAETSHDGSPISFKLKTGIYISDLFHNRGICAILGPTV